MKGLSDHITQEQRGYICKQMKIGTALWKIAESLGVKVSVLEKELLRGMKKGCYVPELAQINYNFERKRDIESKRSAKTERKHQESVGARTVG